MSLIYANIYRLQQFKNSSEALKLRRKYTSLTEPIFNILFSVQIYQAKSPSSPKNLGKSSLGIERTKHQPFQ
jgi:hypothetical protein